MSVLLHVRYLNARNWSAQSGKFGNEKTLLFSLIIIPALVTAILGIRTNGIGLGAARKTFWILGANDFTDFMISTHIGNSQLRNIVTERFFGTEPTEIKVEGQALFKVAQASVELEFDGRDVDPYKPLPEDEGTVTEPVESGTKGALSE